MSPATTGPEQAGLLGWWNRLPAKGEVSVVVGIVFVVGLLVIPLPAFLLDLLLALSIAFALIVLLTALNTEKALDFSSFPSVILLLTLYRLALNVSTTRLILGEGDAGRVIEAFGQFVIGGNYVVGVVIFLILVGINFIVITKGSGRVAEVAARFTLDAMPGRQMSIDGDLNAGIIDEDEARRRREEISQEADFYGAMDGAAKFVRGDAIAALLITLINILGGIFIGMVQRGMPLNQALQQYTILTVGDGLVTQIPALVVATAAGIMVTTAASGDRLGNQVLQQMGGRSKPLWISSGFLATLAIVPGMPTVPFIILAMMAALAARFAPEIPTSSQAAAAAAAVKRGPAQAELEGPPEPREATPVQDLLQIDPVELEVGYALIPLVDQGQGGDLLERIRLLRKQAAVDLGILIPPIRIRDDIGLEASEYVIRIRGTEAARGNLRPRLLMALDAGEVEAELDGERAIDPSFGLPARWISPDDRVEAEARGWTVVEPGTVLSTHLMEVLKEHAAELLGRQDVQELVDTLKESYPALVEEVVPARVGIGTLHRVLQRLLRERVPIRDLVTVLETLADVSEKTKDPEALTEYVRRALGPVIADMHADPDGSIRGITIGPRLETALTRLFSPRPGEGNEIVEPGAMTRALTQLDELAREHTRDGRPRPVITAPTMRVGVRRLLEPVLPNIPILSLGELPPQVAIESVATWEMES
ncbi:MAG: flagellar biosynthesis protein FlhA [Gemmatimonadales bacterium]|nr:MAG: flagellar biosynthesis protein FlhA [Gemmatimonadales bacterium]